mmetsp:Transcript_4762/g.6991  ORF Transcript_4762/g.6991 Transcript_4762/m.6991 type:complete len:267 (+) Transcript_4762:1-801(+)
MQNGDIIFAMYNARVYCVGRFFHGARLDEVVRDTQVFEKQMIEYKHTWARNVINVLRIAALTLINFSDDPLQHSNDFLADGKKLLKKDIEESGRFKASVYCFFFSFVAYIFCNYDYARDLTKTRWKIEKGLHLRYMVNEASYFDALLSIALAQRTKEDEWQKHALECYEKVRRNIDVMPHRILIMETEMDVMMGQTKDAIGNYDKAINAAKESELIHEEAIANERAGDFCLSQGDVRASNYYGKAYNLYLQWGAEGKADNLKKKSL